MSRIKLLIKTSMAFLMGFIIVNCLCYFYERPVGLINRGSGVTSGVRHPNSILIHGTEGYAISYLASNGFTNPDKPLINDRYILVMGSSHTQGKEVSDNKKYTFLLDQYISGEDNDYLSVYNVAHDGNNLPIMIKRFEAGIEEFPNASCVVIEIASTDYSYEQLENSLNQTSFNEAESTKALFERTSLFNKLKVLIKEYLPLVSLYKKQLDTYIKSRNDQLPEIIQYDTDQYADYLDKCLKLIRSEFKGKIIFAYHPYIEIQKDGSMICKRSETYETFVDLCEKNNINVLDVGDSFISHYNENCEVPYGFWNTTMGTGHLNEVGHEIMANELYKFIKEIQ